MSIQLFPATLAQFWPAGTQIGNFLKTATDWLQPGASIWASLIFSVLVLFFTYFYTAIQYDNRRHCGQPQEVRLDDSGIRL